MTRTEILDSAKRCVVGDREQDYGSPENNFKTIADFWSAYLGKKVSAKDVAAMLALLKIARIGSGHAKADNWRPSGICCMRRRDRRNGGNQ